MLLELNGEVHFVNSIYLKGILVYRTAHYGVSFRRYYKYVYIFSSLQMGLSLQQVKVLPNPSSLAIQRITSSCLAA